ncbi:Rab3 GTPase-activating protein catalytic subunit [Linnemannia exigua]|uniref:Rab3 GTPase-activating protein catalytic subunit n=1 Tax=Linnemannia exigua TaxID=604196 RepID=A0AAD4DHW1_9FUNG|nr:Rab3 GTPase-activating protein catalytic subunit [Linnemannia exigua]
MADMDADDFENFEFIDYTTSGPWEKFIIQIESCLKQWGLVHNSYGVFNPKRMPATDENMDLDQELALALHDNDERKANTTTATESADATVAKASPTSNKAGSSRSSGVVDSNASQVPSLSNVYQHDSTVTLDGVPYTLSYRYHPAKARIASGVERIDLDFLPTTLEGFEHHSLHRWTALTHILVLSPAPDSHSPIIDLGLAKLLQSSFAIAFQNTGCNIPVFVPTGQVRNGTYMGLSIQPQLSHARNSDLGLDEMAEDQAIEVRYNTLLVPYPPAQYTDLAGILELFIERMGIDDDYADMDDGDDDTSEGYSQQLKEQIFVSALFSYQLDNWYDEDWRQWADKGDDTVTKSRERLPDLPFGPVQDPLKSIHLVARFASAPSTVYLDSKNLTDMDASQANIWILKAIFKPDDYGLLSGILEDAVSSWNVEVKSLLGASKDQASEKGEGSYTSLLMKGARLIQGTIAMVDASDVENIVDDLCTTPSPSASITPYNDNTNAALQPTQRQRSHSQGTTDRVISAAELGLHFRRATTVPYNSFLWKMLRHLVDVISPNSHISYPTSFMGFTKAVWADLLMQFDVYWERKEMIPLIDIFGEAVDEYASDDDDGSGSLIKATFIDFRFNLMHQKLSMINCCISWELALRQDEQSSSPSPTTSTSSSADSAAEESSPELPKEQPSLKPTSVSGSAEPGDDAPMVATADDTKPSDSINRGSGAEVKHDALAESLGEMDINASATLPKSTTATPPPKDAVETKISHHSEGGLKPFKDLKLLATGAPMMVPKLQDQGYMTEDMIQDQEDLLENLGSSADAAKTRAELQSSQLISGKPPMLYMGAFKAANPGCTIGDFIRWHSPKDWDEKKAQMSARMADSGNFWQELWEKAEALPASKQKPLFDHYYQAEKALSYLKNQTGSQIFIQLLPSICLLAYDTLTSHPVSTVSPQATKALQELAQVLTDFPWDQLSATEKKLDLEPIIAKFKQAEQTVGRVVSLLRKFPEQFSLVERILKDSESVVEDGTERDCVLTVFSAAGFAKTVFPKPTCREFVMETFDPVSSPSSSFIGAPGPTFVTPDDLTGWDARPLQRRMYACFKDSEVRIVDAVAKDGMFM